MDRLDVEDTISQERMHRWGIEFLRCHSWTLTAVMASDKGRIRGSEGVVRLVQAYVAGPLWKGCSCRYGWSACRQSHPRKENDNQFTFLIEEFGAPETYEGPGRGVQMRPISCMVENGCRSLNAEWSAGADTGADTCADTCADTGADTGVQIQACRYRRADTGVQIQLRRFRCV
ncbi:hypothetical protein EJ05DRAFT_504997 [Pseudovirgaria hyperparasitica]|uniref:Uncharacterized protein n=1 Tax=Pseudovirgaria hyperparasitica TaxID=470096 RepID=A0A6A6VUQ6_9PEZI|nr:uncharacterized protein EJ05DRAFT_504997 [Pseudovirgaria hyperparasitica]KAF2753350.1 hypothetical protein EJ05DRAFT_504997 [Pseudovirgaria hyperparasitica]